MSVITVSISSVSSPWSANDPWTFTVLYSMPRGQPKRDTERLKAAVAADYPDLAAHFRPCNSFGRHGLDAYITLDQINPKHREMFEAKRAEFLAAQDAKYARYAKAIGR